MPDFDKKQWLDSHVVPLLTPDPPASLYTVFWNGVPPKDVLVYLLPVDPPEPRETWPQLVKRLLEADFRFDYTREIQLVPLEGKMVPIFGGDGAPLFNPTGAVAVRLFQKQADGINLILHVGHRYTDGLVAADGVKRLFALWDENPLAVVQRYSASFGQA